MAKTTTNYKLTKPERSDNYNVDVMGNNMDIIDAELKEHDNVVNGGAVKSSSITNSGNISNTGTITSTGKITANGGIGTTSLTTSGTITSTGIITANGGVKGNLTGNVTGKVYVNAKTTTSKKNGDVQYATCAKQEVKFNGETAEKTLTVAGYSKISMSYPYQLAPGICIPAKANFTDSVPSTVSRTLTVTQTTYSSQSALVYINDTYVGAASRTESNSYPYTGTVNVGDVVKIKTNTDIYCTATVSSKSTYYINVV